MHERNDPTLALDSSLIPTAEFDLAPLAIADDEDHVVDLTAITGFTPTILLVRADGDFQEGNDVPDQTNDFWRDGGMIHSIACDTATAWHFKRHGGSSTVNVYIKVLGAH